MSDFVKDVLPITLITSVGLTYVVFVMFSFAYILTTYVPSLEIKEYVMILTIILASSIIGMYYLHNNLTSSYIKIFGVLTLIGSTLFSSIYLLFYVSDKLGFPLIYSQFKK